jgi:hypothetical protein
MSVKGSKPEQSTADRVSSREVEHRGHQRVDATIAPAAAIPAMAYRIGARADPRMPEAACAASIDSVQLQMLKI